MLFDDLLLCVSSAPSVVADKAIFGFGYGGSGDTNITNLVSNTGVVASDQSALTGTARDNLAAATY